MTLPASDAFGRADANPIGGNWTTVSDLLALRIVSNAVQASSTGDGAAYWNADSFNADQWAECKITSGSDGGPAVRCSASGGYYWTPVGGGQVWRYKTGAAWTKIGDLAVTVTASDVIRIEATGGATTSLKVYKNGVQQGSTLTDASSPLTAGSAGLYSVGATVLDDWQGGNYSANTSDQEGYRWRNDDGSESGATWAANQDAALTAPIGAKRLRVIVNATGDLATAQYQLEWKKSTDSLWRTVQ